MNLVLLTKNDLISPTSAEINGRRFEHIRQVLRLKEGDQLKVGMIDGKMGTGNVVAINSQGVTIKFKLTQNPPKPLNARLIIALPRPPMVKRILFTAAMLGIKGIYFIHSSRVEKSFWKSSALAPNEINEQLTLGLEQAVDTMMPQVYLRDRFKPFVEDELPPIAQKTKKYLAHPDAKAKTVQSISTPATIVVGPEGGFIPYEVEKLNDLGFKNISLGKRILRVETAVTVLLGRCLKGS